MFLGSTGLSVTFTQLKGLLCNSASSLGSSIYNLVYLCSVAGLQGPSNRELSNAFFFFHRDIRKVSSFPSLWVCKVSFFFHCGSHTHREVHYGSYTPGSFEFDREQLFSNIKIQPITLIKLRHQSSLTSNIIQQSASFLISYSSIVQRTSSHQQLKIRPSMQCWPWIAYPQCEGSCSL